MKSDKNILCWIPFIGIFWLYYISDWGRYHPRYYVSSLFYLYQTITTFILCFIFMVI